MFKLLIKHEIRELWKNLRVLWGVALMAYLLALGTMLIHNPILNGMALFIAILSLLALSIGPIIFIVTRYYRTMAGSEAYFTHTLPIDSATIFGAKFLVAFVIELLSFSILFPLIYNLIRYSVAVGMPQVPLTVAYKLAGELLSTQMSMGFGPSIWLILSGVLIYAIFSLLNSVFFSVAKGSEARFHHLGGGDPNTAVIGIGIIPVVLLFSLLLFFLTIRSHRHYTSVR